MDKCGTLPRSATVEEIANILLAAYGIYPPPTVGVNWPSNFVKRRDELRTRFSKRYDHQRALNEGLRSFRAGFATVQRIIDEKGLSLVDISTLMRRDLQWELFLHRRWLHELNTTVGGLRNRQEIVNRLLRSN